MSGNARDWFVIETGDAGLRDCFLRCAFSRAVLFRRWPEWGSSGPISTVSCAA